MKLKLSVELTEKKTTIECNQNQDRILITDVTGKSMSLTKPAVYLLIKEQTVVQIGHGSGKIQFDEAIDQVIEIQPSAWENELAYLEQAFVMEAKENGLALVEEPVEVKIPKNQQKTVTEYKKEVLFVLERFGYSFVSKVHEAQPAKARPAKARHRWSKEVSQIEFSVDTRESKATVFWQKRNEMLIKAGAKLRPVAPLNKDGSIGFSAKMGDKIRQEQADKIKDFTTTEDIILKSVNEVGLFLYFAGTNSWLELVDQNGKSIDAWTRVDE